MNEENRNIALSKNLDPENVFNKFKAYAKSHEWTRVNWDEALKKWILDEHSDELAKNNKTQSTVPFYTPERKLTDEERKKSEESYKMNKNW